MSKYSKTGKVAKAGAVDSKYFGDMEQFEADIVKKLNESKEFKTDLRELIIKGPSKIEQRYNEAIEVLLEIKEKYD